jgi:hypothetical protein
MYAHTNSERADMSHLKDIKKSPSAADNAAGNTSTDFELTYE